MSLDPEDHSMLDDHLCNLNATADKIHTEAFEIKECMQRIASACEAIAIASMCSRNLPKDISAALLRAHWDADVDGSLWDRIGSHADCAPFNEIAYPESEQ